MCIKIFFRLKGIQLNYNSIKSTKISIIKNIKQKLKSTQNNSIKKPTKYKVKRASQRTQWRKQKC